MGSLQELNQKRNTINSPVAEVTMLSLSANPVSGSRIFITPTEYYFASAAAGIDATRPATVLVGASVSATVSALSAMVNLVNTAYGRGPTAATTAGSTTDLDLTAKIPGEPIDITIYNTSGAAVAITFTDTTAGVGGRPLGEGFLYLTTSAGNKLPFRTPGDRFAYQSNPANAAQLGANRGESNNQN